MDTLQKIFNDNGFHVGRMISGSKSGYRHRNPDNDAVFNARIFIPKHKEPIWWGDLDITLDCNKLQKICDEINKEMLVFYESVSWYAEGKKYKEIENHAHAKFTPKANTYLSRVYDGMEGLKAGNMTIIASKGINWIEKELNKE